MKLSKLAVGLHWARFDFDELHVIFTQSVVYLPEDPRIVMVSAKADFRTTSGGGVWRSEDGGMTWTQAVSVRWG